MDEWSRIGERRTTRSFPRSEAGGENVLTQACSSRAAKLLASRLLGGARQLSESGSNSQQLNFFHSSNLPSHQAPNAMGNVDRAGASLTRLNRPAQSLRNHLVKMFACALAA